MEFGDFGEGVKGEKSLLFWKEVGNSPILVLFPLFGSFIAPFGWLGKALNSSSTLSATVNKRYF